MGRIPDVKVLRHFAHFFILLLLSKNTLSATSQILNDSFFQNPAELNAIHQRQIIIGNLLVNPTLHFTGTSYGATGTANSNVVDNLPFVLTAFRFTDKFVLGFNILPSAYGHVEWPISSFVNQSATQTKVVYYRFGAQSSYQFNDKLAIGLGLNADYNQLELNRLIPGQGNQVNRITGVNYVGDLGLYYKINSKHYLTLAGYTQVNTYGHGISTTPTEVNPNLTLNITEAPVYYIGLEHLINEKWFFEEKIYWSVWSIQKNIDLINTTSGTYAIPTNWKDVFSFQISTRYALLDKLALLGSAIYETNPVPLSTNAIGYPLAACGSLSAGVDITLLKTLSMQALYSYGKFLPNSPINNANNVGMIKMHFQAAVLQLTYKV